MIGEKAYVRTVKCLLLILALTCAGALITWCVIDTFFPSRNNIKLEAISIFFLLLFPICRAANYFADPIQREIKRSNFSDDKEMKKALMPLLKSIDSSVRVGRFPAHELNAFAISSITGKKSLIGFSTGLMESKPTEDQFLAIAAHEIAHIKNGDSQNKVYILAFNDALQLYPLLLSELSKNLLSGIFLLGGGLALIFGLVMVLISGVSAAINFLSNIFLLLIRAGWIPALIVIGVFGLSYLLKSAFFAYSRGREFAADAGGAAMTSPEKMINALNLISDPDSNAVISVFDTHPPLVERIRRLRGKNT